MDRALSVTGLNAHATKTGLSCFENQHSKKAIKIKERTK